ncbi:MAG: putative metal-binding motif-containing protein [Myxococcales bacterium]|nr:putative metal-binding motif-containing protein [Myxococcales bacterium]
MAHRSRTPCRSTEPRAPRALRVRAGLARVRAPGVVLLAAAALAASVDACDSSAPFPFDLFDPGLGGGTAAAGGTAGAGGAVDPELGGPCSVDAQCDDGVACTFDRCDHDFDRCRFAPDDSQCQNGGYCDGVERCALGLGCQLGEPVTCTQGNACIIASCVEAEALCLFATRDVDGDGDADAHCQGGHDCNDADPSVNGGAPEICGNAIDDDCNGTVDDPSCVAPAHDVCADPIVLAASGGYPFTSVAASLDYAASCALATPAARDIVAAVVLPPGPPVDLELTARVGGAANVAVSVFSECAPGAELACSGSFPALPSGHLAKVRVRQVGDPVLEVALPVYVWTDIGATGTLELQILPPVPAPTNETCGTALPITPGVPVVASLVGVAKDLASACTSQTGELVYAFDLAASADVDVYAVSLDGDGQPALSLRGPGCALPEDEIGCQLATGAHVHRTALPPGSYFVAVGASAPTDVSVTVELAPPGVPPADETCAGAPALPPNQTLAVVLADHQDDLATGCIAGAVDAAYALELAVPSDVLLVGRRAQGDVAAVALLEPPCAGLADVVACGTGNSSPVRAARRNLPAGSYRAVAESLLGEDMQLTALVRPAVPPTIVPFADDCSDALVIPAEGGFFQGTTANAHDDFSAGCDQAGSGAPDQFLKLVLPAPKRVVLDMMGSGYATLIDVRQGPTCPGTEVPNACAVGYDANRSYLDLDLAAGTYYLQVDGYTSQSGPWFLDVRVVDP